MTQDILGGFQQLVMLAVLRLGADAHGGRIQRELEETVERTVSISTVYVTLDRLDGKGMVRSWLADPTPVRGGKAKRYYAVTEAGLEALQGARNELLRMWDGVDDVALKANPR